MMEKKYGTYIYDLKTRKFGTLVCLRPDQQRYLCEDDRMRDHFFYVDVSEENQAWVSGSDVFPAIRQEIERLIQQENDIRETHYVNEKLTQDISDLSHSISACKERGKNPRIIHDQEKGYRRLVRKENREKVNFEREKQWKLRECRKERSRLQSISKRLGD